jgi:hypothetical protein
MTMPIKSWTAPLQTGLQVILKHRGSYFYQTGNGVLEILPEALGGIVQTIAFSELPMALQQGVVDGQENPVSVIYAYKIFETQKHLAMTGHTYNSMVHVISKATWDKLTKEQQKIVREESKKAGDWMRKTLREAEAGQIKKLKYGMLYPVILDFISLMFFIALTYFGLVYTIRSAQWTSILHISVRFLYVCVPVSATIMTVYTLRNIFNHIREARKGTR